MKNFKKLGVLVLVIAMAMSMFTACAKDEPTPEPTPEPEPEVTSYVDGTYTAEMPDFDAETGWKDNAAVTIKDDKISAVVFNGTSKDTTKGDKLSEVAAGNYDMTVAGAIASWDVQAKAVQDYIIETQDTTSITFDAAGKSDAISGATISYGHFMDLVNEALAQAKEK